MSVITLRGLNPGIERKVRRHASQKGKSMNRYLVDLIEESITGSKGGKLVEFKDLDNLIGAMNDKDVEEIERSMSIQREIEHELWR